MMGDPDDLLDEAREVLADMKRMRNEEGDTYFTNICNTEGCDNLTDNCFHLTCDECVARLAEERQMAEQGRSDGKGR